MITEIIILWDDLLYKIYNLLAQILFIFRYPKLKKILKRNTRFLNMHKGQTAVLLLNGPSALNHNLEKLFSGRKDNKNYKIFAVNNFAKNDFQFEAIPDYYLVTDSDFFAKDEERTNNLNSTILKYVNNSNIEFIFNIKYLENNILSYNINVVYCKHMPTNKSIKSNMSKLCSNFFNVSNYALNIISYMGFKNVYILGLDFGQNWNHFTIEDNESLHSQRVDSKTYDISSIWQYYSSIRQSYIVSFLFEDKLQISNLNPKSKVHSFYKSNIEVNELLNQLK